MEKKERTPKIFLGWWIVLASGILAFWGAGFGNFGFSALFKPIASELHFSRAATSIAPSVSLAERGFVSPIVGWIADRFGPRWVVLCGVFLIGLALLLMSFVNSLWAYFLVWGVLLGAGTNMGAGIALDKTITNWFVKKRGRALSIKSTFHAVAGMLMLPIVGWLVSIYDWRMTCVIAGTVMLLIGPTLAWFFIKQRRPEFYGLLPDGAAVEETEGLSQTIERGVKYAAQFQEIEFTLRQAMRTPSFWLLLLTNATAMFVPPVLTIHGVPILTDMGVDPVRAAVLLGLMGSTGIPGALFSGLMADRLETKYLRFLATGAFSLFLIAFVTFLLNKTTTTLYPLFAIYNFLGGLHSTTNSILLARYFGRKAFGSIRGTLAMFMLPVSVFAPIYAGWIYDTTQSYTTVFIVCSVLTALSTLFISLASPPKAPAQVTDIYKIV